MVISTQGNIYFKGLDIGTSGAILTQLGQIFWSCILIFILSPLYQAYCNVSIDQPGLIFSENLYYVNVQIRKMKA